MSVICKNTPSRLFAGPLFSTWETLMDYAVRHSVSLLIILQLDNLAKLPRYRRIEVSAPTLP